MQGGSKEPVDVVALMDSDVPSHLWDIVQMGALIGMSVTKDGGALSITVTFDSEYVREYFRNAEDAVEWLELVKEVLREEIAARPASAAPGRAKRGLRAV